MLKHVGKQLGSLGDNNLRRPPRKKQPALAQSMDYSETPFLGCALGGICERHLIPLGVLRACLLKFVSTVRARCHSVTGSRRIVWRFRFERHLGAMAEWAFVDFRAGFEFPLDHTQRQAAFPIIR